MKRVTTTLILLFLTVMGYAQETTIILEPLKCDNSQTAYFVNAVLAAELSSNPKIRIVERAKLDKLLAEKKLKLSDLTRDNGDKSKLLAANFIISGSISNANDNIFAILKVTNIATSEVKSQYLQASKDEKQVDLAQKITAKYIKMLNSKDNFWIDNAPKAEKYTLTPKVKRPKVMVCIPEIHISNIRTIDPAAETQLVQNLIAQKFPVINLNQKELINKKGKLKNLLTNAETLVDYAKRNHVDIVIYGEAFSEKASAFGDFHGCRARVELKAIKTADSSIIFSGSCYAGKADISEVIAGKKAIQAATDKISPKIMEAITTGGGAL